MNSCFVENLDFIFLIYGLAFFLLAMVAFSMSQARGQGVTWIWLGLFGVVNGLNEWADMVAPALGESMALMCVRSVLLIVSFLFLFEFGRCNVIWSGRGRVGRWIYIPLLVLLGVVAFQFGGAGMLSSTRYVLAFPGGLLAAMALWQWGAPSAEKKRNFLHRLSAMAMVGYAVLAGLVAPRVDFGLATIINADAFLATTGMPIQLFRCGLACVIALVIWREHFIWRRDWFFGTDIKWIVNLECGAGFVVLMILIFGFVTVNRIQRVAGEEARTSLLNMSQLIEAAINPERVARVVEEKSNSASPDYTRLRKQCQAMADSGFDIRYLYLMRKEAGHIIFLIDVEPSRYSGISDYPNAQLGDVYQDAPPEIDRVFEARTSVVQKKAYSDRWGRFVSAYSPILDPQSGNVLAVLGVDQADARLDKSILQKRLLPVLVTAMLALLIMMFTVIGLRIGEENQLRTLSLLRAQDQQETLWKLADSIIATDGNSISVWHRIAEEAARVVGVDHVVIMFIDPDKQEFHMEDRFDVARGLHSAGEVVSGKNYEVLKGIFEEGRTLAVDEVMSGKRISDLKSWCLESGSRCALFSPFKVSGKGGGIIVFSQKCAGRKWLSDEVRFAFELANLVSRSLVNRDRDRAEKALSKANEELEVRIRERTEQLFQKNIKLRLEIEERERLEAGHNKLEAQIRQAQKLESLGVMAGGIAHDFNNILMAILGNAELVRLELPPGTPVRGYIQDIETAANRAAALSTQMLAYSGRAFIQIQAVDLNALIRDMSGILEAAVSKKVTLLYTLEETLKTIDGDSSQIGQILLNLVINATEAIGDEAGVITIQTGTLWCDPEMLTSLWVNETMPEGEYVYLEVRDTGCGMEQGILPQIFDPFFTTKFTGRGLGLAAVIGIVRGHSGTIQVCSETKHGTTFRVYFPVGRLPSESPEKPVERDKYRGCGAILLVDDEEQVRELGVNYIERLGYRVVEAVDGFDAIEKFKQNQADIRCVLMDLTMPQCDGYEALRELRKVDPAVKVILCSGYIKEDVLARFSDLNIDGFLHKPYGSEALAMQVEETLRGDPREAPG
ncbi:MAG: response regulator [bacterium]